MEHGLLFGIELGQTYIMLDFKQPNASTKKFYTGPLYG